jgi:hypothetical protein
MELVGSKLISVGLVNVWLLPITNANAVAVVVAVIVAVIVNCNLSLMFGFRLQKADGLPNEAKAFRGCELFCVADLTKYRYTR